MFERKDSAKIGVQKNPTCRINKNIESVNAIDYSKIRRNSKVYADMNFFSKNLAEKQNLLLDSKELHNFLLNFKEGSLDDKNLSSNEAKSLSYSNKHQKMSASTSNSENSNNFLKIPEPICPDSSRISNYSSTSFKKKFNREHEKLSSQLNTKFFPRSLTHEELKKF